jgi:hypothetical protein
MGEMAIKILPWTVVKAPMETRYAANFDEYIGWMATNSPHATVLDWGRRIECARNEFIATLHPLPRGADRWQVLQTAIVTHPGLAHIPRLGHITATILEEMRDLRNRVAHDPRVSISPEQATDYACHAFSLIWMLADLRDHAEEAPPTSR